MRYAGIIYDDIANGPGVRVTLFVQGCFRKCKGCQNPETWDVNGGEIFTDEVEDEIFDYIENTPFVQGLTISGGEPLVYNLKAVHDLVNGFRLKFGDTKDIWLFTGYTWEELMEFYKTLLRREDPICRRIVQVLEKIDVLVEGPFIEELKDSSLRFRGSSNQRIIDVKKTLNKFVESLNNIEEWKEDESK